MFIILCISKTFFMSDCLDYATLHQFITTKISRHLLINPPLPHREPFVQSSKPSRQQVAKQRVDGWGTQRTTVGIQLALPFMKALRAQPSLVPASRHYSPHCQLPRYDHSHITRTQRERGEVILRKWRRPKSWKAECWDNGTSWIS